MKFIHTADLHLDSPFVGLKDMPPALWQRVRSSTHQAFIEIVNAAIEHQVDFVVISGDLYDSDHPSIRTRDFFIQQCQRLAAANIPVYLIYGNHDHQAVVSWPDLPANVQVFGNHVETKLLTLGDQTKVAFTGFSYQHRWVEEDMVVNYPQRLPGVDWQIGLLHGDLHQHDLHYAPFSLTDLQNKGYDYWALGHIHKNKILANHPVVVYSGTPQGRQINEAGPHGYYLVKDQGSKLVPSFNVVDKIEWQTLTIEVDQLNDLTALEQTVIQQTNSQLRSAPFSIVQLQLIGQLGPHLQQLLVNGSLLTHLQTRAQASLQWWPCGISYKKKHQLPSITALDQDYWEQAATRVFTLEKIIAAASSLTKEKFIADELLKIDPNNFRRQVTDLLAGREHGHED